MTVTKPLIGLDVDGVLYRWGKAVRAVMLDKYGLDIPEDEWFSKEHCTAEQWDWIWSKEGVELVFGSGEPFPGAVEFVSKLREVASVRILTACPPLAQDARVKWLRKHGILYDELAWVDPPAKNDGISAAHKSAVMPHCDYYIDDNPGNCVELSKNTNATVILVDHSWNRDEKFENLIRSNQIIRLSSWDDILMEVMNGQRV